MRRAIIAAVLALGLVPAPAIAGGYLHAEPARVAVIRYAEAHVEQMKAFGAFARCRRRLTARAVDCFAGYANITDETGTYDFLERVTVRLDRRGRVTVTSALFDEPTFVARGVRP